MATRPNITWPFIISTLALLLVAAVVVMSLQRVIAAAFMPSYADNQASATLAEFEEVHEQHMEMYAARIKGRSLFYKPTPTPRPKPPKVEQTVTEQPVVTPRPSIPTKGPYSGPTPAVIFGDTVWFKGGKLDEPAFFVAKGETKKYNGGTDLTVTDIEFPQKVFVKYGEWEYELDLIDNWNPTLKGSTTLASVRGVTITNGGTTTPSSDVSGVPGVGVPGASVIPSDGDQSAAVIEGVSELAGFGGGPPGPVSAGREKPITVGDPEEFPDAPQDDTAATGGPPE